MSSQSQNLSEQPKEAAEPWVPGSPLFIPEPLKTINASGNHPQKMHLSSGFDPRPLWTRFLFLLGITFKIKHRKDTTKTIYARKNNSTSCVRSPEEMLPYQLVFKFHTTVWSPLSLTPWLAKLIPVGFSNGVNFRLSMLPSEKSLLPKQGLVETLPSMRDMCVLRSKILLWDVSLAGFSLPESRSHFSNELFQGEKKGLPPMKNRHPTKKFIVKSGEMIPN